MRILAGATFVLVSVLAVVGCRDASRFSTRGDRFQGDVVKGSFVRSGIGEDTQLCLTLDMDRLQDAPGTLSTSDGRFQAAPLRPIPQIWHDPLSTLNFGDGRIQNLIYAVSPRSGDAGVAETETEDVLAIVSLMQTDHIEVRLIRGAPQTNDGPRPPGSSQALFGVFNLDRQVGPCAF